MANAVEIRMLLVHPQKPLNLVEAPRISVRGKRSISIVARRQRQRQRPSQTPEQAIRRARPQDWVLHPESGKNSSSSSSSAFLITIYLPIGVTRDDFEFFLSRLPVERWLFFNPFAGFAFCECSTKMAADEALEALHGFPVGDGAIITAFLGRNDVSEQSSTGSEGQLWKHHSETTKGRAPKLWKKMIVRETFGDWEQFRDDDHRQNGFAKSADTAQGPNKSLQDSDVNTVPQLWEPKSGMISNSSTSSRFTSMDSDIIDTGWKRQSGMNSNSSTDHETWDQSSTGFMSMGLQDSDINNSNTSTSLETWDQSNARLALQDSSVNNMTSNASTTPERSVTDMNTVPQLWERQSSNTDHENWDMSMALQDSDINTGWERQSGMNSNTSTSPETWDQSNRLALQDSNINTSSRAWDGEGCMNSNSNTTPETWDTISMNMPSDINTVPQAWEHQSRIGSHSNGSPGACAANHANESTSRAPETWEQSPMPKRVNIREFWKKHNVNTIYWRPNLNPQPEGKLYGPWKPPKVVKPEDYQHLFKFAEIPELMVNGKPYRRSPTRRLFEMADRCPELWTNVDLPPIWKINLKQAASSSEMSPKLWDLWRPACTTNAPLGVFRELRSQIYAYYRERHRRFPTWKLKPEEIKKHPKHKEYLLRYLLTQVGSFGQDFSFERLPWEKSQKWTKSRRRKKLYETSK